MLYRYMVFKTLKFKKKGGVVTSSLRYSIDQAIIAQQVKSPGMCLNMTQKRVHKILLSLISVACSG